MRSVPSSTSSLKPEYASRTLRDEYQLEVISFFSEVQAEERDDFELVFISQGPGSIFRFQGTRGGRDGSHPGSSPAWQPGRGSHQSLCRGYAVPDAFHRSQTHVIRLSRARIKSAVHVIEI